jgi:nicotinate-nucleotide adenylyltransferase
MHVALYGGSFNPPHVAHQMVALYVLETAPVPVDELWLVPCFRHPFDKPLAPFVDRLRMCELAAAALGPRVRVSDIERAIGGLSRTLHTVRRLRELHPDDSFSLVVGSDLAAELPTWFGAEELRALVPFIVVGRHGAPLVGRHGAPAPGDTQGAVAMPEVSSTEVRRAIAAGKSPTGLVPRAVLDYIYDHSLYREPA